MGPCAWAGRGMGHALFRVLALRCADGGGVRLVARRVERRLDPGPPDGGARVDPGRVVGRSSRRPRPDDRGQPRGGPASGALVAGGNAPGVLPDLVLPGTCDRGDRAGSAVRGRHRQRQGLPPRHQLRRPGGRPVLDDFHPADQRPDREPGLATRPPDARRHSARRAHDPERRAPERHARQPKQRACARGHRIGRAVPARGGAEAPSFLVARRGVLGAVLSSPPLPST